MERLLEHKKYKQLAAEISRLEEEASYFMYKEPTIPKEVLKYQKPVDLDKLFKDVNMELLNKIYREVLLRQEERVDKERSKFGTIKREKVSLEEKIGSVLNYINKKKKFSFRSLLEKTTSKTELVVTFLAILELMKVGRINLKQEKSFDDMEIEAVDGEYEKIDLSGLEDL